MTRRGRAKLLPAQVALRPLLVCARLVRVSGVLADFHDEPQRAVGRAQFSMRPAFSWPRSRNPTVGIAANRLAVLMRRQKRRRFSRRGVVLILALLVPLSPSAASSRPVRVGLFGDSLAVQSEPYFNLLVFLLLLAMVVVYLLLVELAKTRFYRTPHAQTSRIASTHTERLQRRITAPRLAVRALCCPGSTRQGGVNRGSAPSRPPTRPG